MLVSSVRCCSPPSAAARAPTRSRPARAPPAAPTVTCPPQGPGTPAWSHPSRTASGTAARPTSCPTRRGREADKPATIAGSDHTAPRSAPVCPRLAYARHDAEPASRRWLRQFAGRVAGRIQGRLAGGCGLVAQRHFVRARLHVALCCSNGLERAVRAESCPGRAHRPDPWQGRRLGFCLATRGPGRPGVRRPSSPRVVKRREPSAVLVTSSRYKAMRTYAPTLEALSPSRLFLFGSLTVCLGVSACASERPRSTTTSGLHTGITSSSGGGVQALGGYPNATVSTRVGPC